VLLVDLLQSDIFAQSFLSAAVWSFHFTFFAYGARAGKSTITF
jgi:hypothetical protein